MERVEDDSTMWVPICCGRVMRHRMFPGAAGATAAASLTCSACGKHILLGPEPIASMPDYGNGSRVIRLLGTPSGSTLKAPAGSVVPPSGMGDETMA